MVIGLLNIVSGYGEKIDLARIAIELQSDVDDLLPVVDVAEALGLIKVENGDITLTSLGKRFISSSPSKKKLMLRDLLKRVEPFATAFKLTKAKREFSANELFKELNKVKELREEYSDPNQIHSMLLEWLLYTEAIRYNGEEKTFSGKS